MIYTPRLLKLAATALPALLFACGDDVHVNPDASSPDGAVIDAHPDGPPPDGESITYPWTFVSFPDFLNADIGDISNLTTLVNSTNAAHETAINTVLTSLAGEHPDFALVAGDLVNGHWYLDASGVQVFGPVDTLQHKTEAVQRGAATYYPIWKQRFASHGLTVYPAVGDHDLGDNDWAANTDKASLVPVYRDAFAKQFTLDGSGNPIYASRPVGTPYEHTAYAVRLKNILLVTVDVFHQENPTVTLQGGQGSVRCEVVGDQLAWLDSVLTAAEADPQIDHIIVQGHVPVLTPVRKQNSSGMTMYLGADSEFWRMLVAHHVDLYFGGEVHDMSTNNSGGVEQVVHGGIMGYAPNVNYLVGKVYEDRIELELKRADLEYPANDTTKLWQAGSNRPRAQYAVAAAGFQSAGTLTIDKSSGETVYQNRTGFFIPIGGVPPPTLPPGLLVHFKLDEAAGSTTAANSGTAGVTYNGAVDGATFVPGKLGNAAVFDASDRIVSGPDPVTGAAARTTAAWIKLDDTSTSIRTVFHLGSNSAGAKWDVDVDATTNKLELGIGNGRTDGTASPAITTGTWHHIAAVLPAGVNNLSGVKLYLDGAPIQFTASATPTISTSGGSLVLGEAANAQGFQQYHGGVDDLAIWSRGLTAIEIGALVSLANTVQYDAGNVDALLTAFAAHANATIGTTTWVYQASGLTGPEGTVVAGGSSQYQLNLGGGAGFVVP
ncbi:MAG: hypothetical protein HOV81_06830 [Kofleriaceae bacterium]|nr:hypothetical protein [Kofleriaceae bacterium]